MHVRVFLNYRMYFSFPPPPPSPSVENEWWVWNTCDRTNQGDTNRMTYNIQSRPRRERNISDVIGLLSTTLETTQHSFVMIGICSLTFFPLFFLFNGWTFRALVKELVETEEEFVTDMEHVVNVYYRQMDHPSTPRKVSDQRDALFGPFKQIQEFHKRFVSSEWWLTATATYILSTENSYKWMNFIFRT